MQYNGNNQITEVGVTTSDSLLEHMLICRAFHTHFEKYLVLDSITCIYISDAFQSLHSLVHLFTENNLSNKHNLHGIKHHLPTFSPTTVFPTFVSMYCRSLAVMRGC
jgi:hypothetical protein